MKKGNVLQLLVFVSIIISGCSVTAQDRITDERKLSGFDKIAMSLPCDLEIQQGEVEGVIIEGAAKDIEKVEMKVKGGTLHIGKKEGESGRLEDLKFIVKVKELHSVAVAGSSDVEFSTPLKTDDLGLKLAGSCDLNCGKLTADNLKIELSGSGDVRIGGEVTSELDIRMAGSGDIRLEELKAKNAKISIAGSGDIRLWITDFLDAQIAGSGDVQYKGNPRIKSRVSGSGDFNPA
ncbi:MAG: DUF2807 domain-containing protein [Bacteroidales bacterium]|nr:DUF2807 domain-containing protein [Bacteroidales bacterium]